MLLFVLAYLGGVLTIVSPCILQVLPFVFARAGQPFLRSTLPMLFSMAATFAAVATLAAVGGGVDTDVDGNGTVTGQRLYQLVREAGPVGDHMFEIHFLDSGAQAFAFTFG